MFSHRRFGKRLIRRGQGRHTDNVLKLIAEAEYDAQDASCENGR